MSGFWSGLAAGMGTGLKLREIIDKKQQRDDLAAAAQSAAPRTTEVASGEEAYQAGQEALQMQLDQAKSDEERQQIQTNFAPTLAALEKDRGRAAGMAYSMGNGGNWQQQDTAFSPAQIAKAKASGIADVYNRWGDTDKASQVLADADRQELAGIQLNQAKRQEKQAADADAWTAGMQDLVKGYGAIGAGEDGTALAPEDAFNARAAQYQKLQQHAMLNPQAAQGWKDVMGDMQKRAKSAYLDSLNPGVGADATKLTDYYKATAKANAAFGDTMTPDQLAATGEKIKTMQKEGFVDALEALSKGDLKGGLDHFNANGEHKINPAKARLVDGKTSETFGGLPTKVLEYVDDTGKVQQINVGDTFIKAMSMREQFEMADKASKRKNDDLKTQSDLQRNRVMNAATSAAMAREGLGLQKAEAVAQATADYEDAVAKGDANAAAVAKRKIIINGGNPKAFAPDAAEKGQFFKLGDALFGDEKIVHVTKGGANTVYGGNTGDAQANQNTLPTGYVYTRDDGKRFKFLGGDRKDPKNWEPQ